MQVNTIQGQAAIANDNANKVRKTLMKPGLDKKLLADILSYTQAALLKDKGPIWNYLTQEKGYSESVIKTLEVGLLNSKRLLEQHLKDLGWSDAKINDISKALGLIGKTHKLLIPFKNGDDQLIGLAARNPFCKDSDALGKYIYSKGVPQTGALFNIQNAKGKELLIVEEPLDCLYLNASGFENVVAIGPDNFDASQFTNLGKLEIEKVTLLELSDQTIEFIFDVLSETAPNIAIQEILFPDDVENLNSLLKVQGLDVLKELYAKSVPVKFED